MLSKFQQIVAILVPSNLIDQLFVGDQIVTINSISHLDYQMLSSFPQEVIILVLSNPMEPLSVGDQIVTINSI